MRLDRTTQDVSRIPTDAVRRLDDIQAAHRVAGGFDDLIKVCVADRAAYRAFLGDKLSSIQGVFQTRTYMVMEEVKNTHVVPVPGR